MLTKGQCGHLTETLANKLPHISQSVDKKTDLGARGEAVLCEAVLKDATLDKLHCEQRIQSLRGARVRRYVARSATIPMVRFASAWRDIPTRKTKEHAVAQLITCSTPR